MRGRRVLNEHHFEGVVYVPTYPRHQNIFQNFQVLRCVDFKARFDEMRRHHLTITCNGEGNYPSVLFICNLINNELFLVDKNADMSSFVFQMVQKLWASFSTEGSGAGMLGGYGLSLRMTSYQGLH